MSNSSQNPEYSREREFKVILEDLQSQFHVFGEGLTTLIEKVEKIETVLPTLATKAEVAQLIAPLVTKAEIAQLATKTDFYQLFNVLSDHETRITTLEK